MQGPTRRQLLASGGGLVLLGATAGCLNESGATTPNDPDGVGEIAAVNGIEMTFVDYEVASELTYVPRGERVTIADEAPDREPTTIEPRTPDHEFLVLVLTIANVSDDEKRIPTSAPEETAFTEGRIYLELQNTQLDPVPVNPDRGFAVGGAYEYDDEWIDRLVLVVGAAGGNLAGGSSLSGWILYEKRSDLDLSELTLVALTNPNGPNRRLTWGFPES